MALDRIKNMLATCSAQDKSQNIMPPTTLYNEGWMLRLVLDWISSANLQTGAHPLCIPNGGRWYSEAILKTPFEARWRKPKDKLAESHTHADGVIGHFKIGGSGKGDLVLNNDSTQIVVLEAKMYSPLSAGIKNVVDYNQAARIVACMANTLSLANREPLEFDHIGFYLLLPGANASKRKFIDQMKTKNILSAIEKRKDQYKDEIEYREKCDWFDRYLIPMVTKLENDASIQMISWESIIDYISAYDKDSAKVIEQFYEKCCYYSKR